MRLFKKYYKLILFTLVMAIIILWVGEMIIDNISILYKLNNTGKLSFLLVFIAGIIDGVNPCALSMLLFFITFIISNSRKNKNILLIGINFALGTFISYFLAGIGMLRVVGLEKYISYFHKAIYLITILLAFFLSYINIKDALRAKRYEVEKIRLQLPDKNKQLIHSTIRNIGKLRFIYISSFVLGGLITLSELLCTGQVYLTTMVLIHSFSRIVQIVYLIIFNIGFIIPILAITFLIHRGKAVVDMSHILFIRLWIIKIFTAAIMVILGIISFINLISIT